MTTLANTEFQTYAGRVENMVERVSGLTDPDARTAALELLQSIMDLHGAAVARMVELLGGNEAGRSSLAKLGVDPLICGLLVLYGVHPVPIEERVSSAVANLAPQLRKHSGSAEVIAVSAEQVRVKIQNTGHGCGSDSLKGMVEQAILEAAPELEEVIVESATSSANGFVPLNLIQPMQEKKQEEKRYEESAA